MMGFDKNVRNARRKTATKAELDYANKEAYFSYKNEATNFTWDLVKKFEKKVLEAELNLFKKEIITDLDASNDPESYNKKLHDAYDFELREHDIILCTCIATSTSVLSKIGNFKQLIIDEAGMTKEPEALVPILLCNPEKVVLIGDHAQLRPIIKSQQARDLGLDQSIFERYCQNVTMLEEQYRMHESICYFPSKQFYNNQLKTKTQNISAIFWPGKHLKNTKDEKEIRVVFIDVKGIESKLTVHSNEGSENSVRNNQEIDCVEKIYKYLAEDGTKKSLIECKDIVILSQYRAQVAGIKSRLKKTNENNVLTVNRKNKNFKIHF
jgi:superfamily I DNA and/or RNA helicase